MAYVYGNSTRCSITFIVFGLIQIAMFTSCFFGCRTDFLDTYASQAWSGGIAIFTGLFGICMVNCYTEHRCGSIFCMLSFLTLLSSIANIALILIYAVMAEVQLAYNNHHEYDKVYDATGIAIYGVGVLASFAVFITAMVASCICCCCEKSPGKGYIVAASTNDTERREPRAGEYERTFPGENDSNSNHCSTVDDRTVFAANTDDTERHSAVKYERTFPGENDFNSNHRSTVDDRTVFAANTDDPERRELRAVEYERTLPAENSDHPSTVDDTTGYDAVGDNPDDIEHREPAGEYESIGPSSTADTMV